MNKKAVAIVSGGLDSVTLAYWLKSAGYTMHLLSFNYGQKHKKELEFAQYNARLLGAEWNLIDLSSITPLISNSALTSDIPVPDGHYASENMKITVVPNRNAIMLSIAYGVAVSEGAIAVALGVHGGDHFIYPDCRPEFIKAISKALYIANDGFSDPNLEILAPFLLRTKAQVVSLGAALQVPFEHTWSCYKGGEKHCGLCGTCQERKEAFAIADVIDPTEYEA